MEYLSALQGIFTALFLIFMIPAIYAVVKLMREPRRKSDDALFSFLAILEERSRHPKEIGWPDPSPALRGVERVYDAQGKEFVLISADALKGRQILLINEDKLKRNLNFDE